MRKSSSCLLVLGLLLGGIAVLVTTMSKPDRQETATASSEYTLGEGIHHGNLTIFPVIARVAKDDDRFITLDEGLKAGTVVVAELGVSAGRPGPLLDNGARGAAPAAADNPFCDTEEAEPATAEKASAAPASTDVPPPPADDPFGAPATPAANDPFDAPATPAAADPFGAAAAVNTVTVLNRSDRPLYLMPGEIIVGGQQDRTLAHETIIPPGDKPVQVEVYCVEHGRWHGRAAHESTAYFAALSDTPLQADELSNLSTKASNGEFLLSTSSLNKESRLAVQAGHGQQAVWEKVNMNNNMSGAQAASDAFTANYVQAVVKDKLQPYIDALQPPVAEQARIVGVVVAINGKPEMADVFGSTPLFRKLWPKLLKSYALDASLVAEKKGTAECTVAAAREFFDSAAQAQVVDNESNGQGLLVTKQSSQRAEIYSVSDLVVPEAAGGASGGGYGGFGGGLHSAAFAK